MIKMLVGIAAIWLALGGAAALLADRHRSITVADVTLGPISLGRELVT
jgi:hypothetical protein